MNYFILLIALIPVFAEIAFDKYRWKKGLNDKPLSTYLRVGVFIILSFVMAWLAPQDSYIRSLITGGLFLFGTHLLFFDWTLNMFRKPRMPLFHHSRKDIWYKVPFYGEVFIKAVVAYSFWAMYFHWDWIMGNTPTKLIEYFKF